MFGRFRNISKSVSKLLVAFFRAVLQGSTARLCQAEPAVTLSVISGCLFACVGRRPQTFFNAPPQVLNLFQRSPTDFQIVWKFFEKVKECEEKMISDVHAGVRRMIASGARATMQAIDGAAGSDGCANLQGRQQLSSSAGGAQGPAAKHKNDVEQIATRRMSELMQEVGWVVALGDFLVEMEPHKDSPLQFVPDFVLRQQRALMLLQQGRNDSNGRSLVSVLEAVTDPLISVLPTDWGVFFALVNFEVKRNHKSLEDASVGVFQDHGVFNRSVEHRTRSVLKLMEAVATGLERFSRTDFEEVVHKMSEPTVVEKISSLEVAVKPTKFLDFWSALFDRAHARVIASGGLAIDELLADVIAAIGGDDALSVPMAILQPITTTTGAQCLSWGSELKRHRKWVPSKQSHMSHFKAKAVMGRQRSTMVGHGRPWSNIFKYMVDHGRPWSTMVDHVRRWSTMGRQTSTMVDPGRPTVVDHARPYG